MMALTFSRGKRAGGGVYHSAVPDHQGYGGCMCINGAGEMKNINIRYVQKRGLFYNNAIKIIVNYKYIDEIIWE